jgi:hypothetical protein
MRLVSVARKQKIALTVADIFKNPKLSALAEVVESRKPLLQPSQTEIEPFSLVDGELSRDDNRREAATLCCLDESDIEDVFPCTPLQAGLLAETIRRSGDNGLTETRIFRVHVDIVRFHAAWCMVVRANPIMRTRIVDFAHQGLMQVLVSDTTPGVQGCVAAQDFGLGTPLATWNISEPCFTWSIHHALYDGWSMPLLLESLATAYQAQAVQDTSPFQAYIKYVQDCSQTEAEKFWKEQSCDLNAQKFPILPSKTYKPKCDQLLSLEIKDVSADGDYTTATKIRLAWAILLSTVTDSADASIATTVSGRQADVPGIEKMTGPTIATVPLRITIDKPKTVKDLLHQVQLQATEMMPFERVGIQQIRRISDGCKLGCEFKSHMVIQPTGKHASEDFLFESSSREDETDEIDPFKLYAICLEFALERSSIHLRASYDSTVVSKSQFQRLAERFENVLRQVFIACDTE